MLGSIPSLESWDSAPDGVIDHPVANIPSLHSRVFKLTFDPNDRKVYEVIADVDATFPDIRYKLYPLAEAGTTACWDEGRDNQPYTFQVEEPVTVYLLISNINLEEDSGAFDVKLTLANTYQRSLAPDIPLLIPEFELKVRASRNGTYSAAITSNTGHGGTTDYTIKSIRQGTEVYLQAPEYIGSGASRKKFTGWSGAVTSKQRSITFKMDSNKTLQANYEDSPVATTYSLTVSSTEDELKVGVDIASNTGHGGKTKYSIPSINSGTQVHLEAPEYIGSGASRKKFASWSGAVTSKQRSITFTMDSKKTLRANYEDSPEITYFTLTVRSSEDNPDQKVGIEITSKTGHGGRTRYTISSLASGTQVYLEAPESAGTRENPKVFSHWDGDVSRAQRYMRSITLVMDGNKSVTAHYVSP